MLRTSFLREYCCKIVVTLLVSISFIVIKNIVLEMQVTCTYNYNVMLLVKFDFLKHLVGHWLLQNSAVQISGVTFREILGTSRGEFAVQLVCRKSLPCTGILFEDINIYSDLKNMAKSLTANAKGVIRGQNIPETRFNNPRH